MRGMRGALEEMRSEGLRETEEWRTRRRSVGPAESGDGGLEEWSEGLRVCQLCV